MIEGKSWFIATYVPDSEEAAEDCSIDNHGDDLYEEDDSGSVEAGVRKCVTQSGTDEVEEVQMVMKYSSLSSYMFKHIYFLTQGFNKNKKA